MATYLNYAFDPELFLYKWENEKDPTLTAMFESGAVSPNAQIANLISTGGDFYTIPFYKTIGGTPDNYDGATNISITDPQGASQSGIVYGRAHGWKDQDFIRDYNSGADPMTQITSQVSKYWQKQRQALMLKELAGIFGVSAAGWNDHTTDISSSTTTVAEANKMGATTIGDAAQKAVGDAASEFSLAIMHSKVANNLAGLKLLEYLKYTDANGIERPLRMGYVNGMLVVVDDGVPYTAATGSVAAKYTTYLFGAGALQFAKAPVDTPVEIERNATANGGYNALITRIRETIHPNGFSFKKPSSGYTASPTDTQLSASANWSIAADPKNIAIARVITNG